jgi:hypothetical protein
MVSAFWDPWGCHPAICNASSNGNLGCYIEASRMLTAPTGLQKAATKHASLDSSSDSPRLPRGHGDPTVNGAASSNASAATAHRARPAWNGTTGAAEQSAPAAHTVHAHRANSGPPPQQPPPPPGQPPKQGPLEGAPGSHRGHGGRAGSRTAAPVPPISSKDSTSAVAAAAAAAAAALRPTPRAVAAGAGARPCAPSSGMELLMCEVVECVPGVPPLPLCHYWFFPALSDLSIHPHCG